jgi:hypothetical protein
MEVEKTAVQCARVFMRIDRDAIRDSAVDLAAEDWESGEIDDAEHLPTANTWEDSGWLYQECERDDAGSVAMWRCKVKPSPALSDHQGTGGADA